MHIATCNLDLPKMGCTLIRACTLNRSNTVDASFIRYVQLLSTVALSVHLLATLINIYILHRILLCTPLLSNRSFTYLLYVKFIRVLFCKHP